MHQALLTDLAERVALALAEDIGGGDITAQLIPETAAAEASILTRESAVLCGRPWVDEVFRQLDPDATVTWLAEEGSDIAPDQVVCRIAGNARALLTGERTAINFLQTLSGTATIARHYAAKVAGTGIRVLDTRKTIPGLRLAQKYAVAVGGCHNHRIGLYDAFLIKENHIAACGGIGAAVARARQIAPGKPVEVEVENLDEYRQALAAGADIIMLDNFELADIHTAIALKNEPVKLEISGNLDDANIARVALPGIDYLSSGSLTKHCRAIDYSMRLKTL
ncbi:MAG: carboxylating nicotinate-nucleotide diphosphorylase [Porticoccaceae bacterium]|jgi:nicotinate-nucleotide pyrophosphorylase (carboxylating)|nr:carboxylating nicotinate-nucleotide diphosphorylase [Porticoccaceae bacterium]MEA3300677.1 carboxylating nicotinate-nucleotide diphosphorylase [Pseudomonadota bacterium]HLS99666.1 carboxylating nicotinate-nucleotide diphosphorylase [Porticoccaceae bacterium]